VPRKEKRCIPKKRYATCPQDMSKKRREEKNIAHVQEQKIYTKERDRSYKGAHPLSSKNIPHTCTS
jgi:hypothetical protein